MALIRHVAVASAFLLTNQNLWRSANISLDADPPNDIAQKILVKALWIDIGTLKPGMSTRPISAPNGLVTLKDRWSAQGMMIKEGNLRDDPRHGHAWQSTGSITIKGAKFPFKMKVEYEYRDNSLRVFKITHAIEVWETRGMIAMRSEDGNVLLIMNWEPMPITSKKGSKLNS